jgi:hypothetical protein
MKATLHKGAGVLAGLLAMSTGASIAWASAVVQVRHSNGSVTPYTVSDAHLAELKATADCQRYITIDDCFVNPASTACVCAAGDLTTPIRDGWLPSDTTDVWGW